jgi:TPR repeat protein
VLAVLGSIAFLTFRAKEEFRVLGARSVLCVQGTVDACDQLRSACTKRSGDACFALANAVLSPGPRHDGPEGLRLLTQACDFRHAEACRRAGALLVEGREVPKDERAAEEFRVKACKLGLRDTCDR